METTEAGLVVPDGTVPKVHRAMSRDFVRQLRRFMKAARAEGFRAVLACEGCATAPTFSSPDRLDPKAPGGDRIAATCKCSERVSR